MTISLTPEQIRELAREINETIKGLTDIDAILEATKEDLDKAQRLKERADNARYLFNIQCDVAVDCLEVQENPAFANNSTILLSWLKPQFS